MKLPPTWGASQMQSFTGHDQGQLLVPSMFAGATGYTVTNATDERTSPPHAVGHSSNCLAMHLIRDQSLFVQGSSSQESLSREPSQGGDHEVAESRMSPDPKRRKLHRVSTFCSQPAGNKDNNSSSQEYRPPTPPLPAQHKRRRLTVSAYPDESEVSHGEASIHRDLQQVPNVVDDREQGGSRSLRPTPSFTTERTFVSLGATPQPLGDTSMASGWSGGLTTFVSESDPRLTHYPLPLYNPPSMRIPDSKNEYEKTRYQAPPPTWSSWLCDTLASCRAGLQRFCVVFCC